MPYPNGALAEGCILFARSTDGWAADRALQGTMAPGFSLRRTDLSDWGEQAIGPGRGWVRSGNNPVFLAQG